MVFRDIDKQAIIENRYRVLSRVSVINTDLVFTEDDSLQEWKLEDFRYVPENGFIGQFVERLFDCKLVDVPEDLNLNDKEVKVEIGIINGLDNDTVTWYSYGNFLVTKVGEKDTSGVVSFECSDYTKMFNKEYKDVIEYPCTALELAQNVCEQVGVELGTTDFVNKDFEIENNRFTENNNCRDVIKAIAQLAYSWARIGEDNKLYIDFTVKGEDDVDEYNRITTDDYYETNKDQEYFGPVNRVLIGMSQVDGENIYIDSRPEPVKPDVPEDPSERTEEQEEALQRYDEEMQEYEDGVCQIAIYDNPLTYNEELREVAIHGAEKLFGLYYIPLTVQSVGQPWLEGDDFISVKVLNDEVLYTYSFDRKLEYSGYIKGEISSQAKNSVSSEYDYAGDVDRRLMQTEIIVDKHTGDITSLTKTTEDITSDLEQNYYNKVMINQVIQNAATGVTNTFSEAGGNNIFRNTGLWFETTGDIQNLLYPSTTLYPSQTLYMRGRSAYEFWMGVVLKKTYDKSSNGFSMLLQKGTLYQDQEVPNGNYTVSFKYKKLLPNANVSVKINENTYNLESLDDKEFVTGYVDTETGEYITQPLEVKSRYITVKFDSDINGSCEIYDLMVNAGTVKLAYSQNQNETITDTVNISKGITITATGYDTKFKADADGIRIYDVKNETEPITRFTDVGTDTNELVVRKKAEIVSLLFKEVGNQIWLTKI